MSIPSPPSKDKDERRPPVARMPTLDDLAKRMAAAAVNSSGGAPSNGAGAPAPASRPRLAQSILSHRTQPAGATSPPLSDRSDSTGILDASLSGYGDEPPKDIPKDKVHRGYKNVPSLDAITERLRARGTSNATSTLAGSSLTDANDSKPVIEPSPTPPPIEEEPVTLPAATEPLDTTPSSDTPPIIPTESTTQPGPSTDSEKAVEHPLLHTWTLFHDSKSRGGAPPTAEASQTSFPDTGSHYAAGLNVVGEFHTVEEFCRYFNWLKPPSALDMNSNYHLFKSGIKPMWEDAANANGGKWVLTMKSNPALLDRCWSWLCMGLVGEQVDERDMICGAVVSLRPKIDRIQLWTRSKDDVERINAIGKRLIKLLDIEKEPGIGFEFQYHADDRADRSTRSKFISIAPPAGGSYYRGPNSAVSPSGSYSPSRGGRGGFGFGSPGGFNPSPLDASGPSIADGGPAAGHARGASVA